LNLLFLFLEFLAVLEQLHRPAVQVREQFAQIRSVRQIFAHDSAHVIVESEPLVVTVLHQLPPLIARLSIGGKKLVTPAHRGTPASPSTPHSTTRITPLNLCVPSSLTHRRGVGLPRNFLHAPTT